MTFYGKSMEEIAAEAQKIQDMFEESDGDVVKVDDITYTQIIGWNVDHYPNHFRVRELHWRVDRLPGIGFLYEETAGGIVAYTLKGRPGWRVLILPEQYCGLNEERFGRVAVKIAGYMERAEDLIEAGKAFKLASTNAIRASQGIQPLTLSELFHE